LLYRSGSGGSIRSGRLDFCHNLSDFHFFALGDFGVQDAGIRSHHFLGNLVGFQCEKEFVAGHAVPIFLCQMERTPEVMDSPALGILTSIFMEWMRDVRP
jgi:hypothetical protein